MSDELVQMAVDRGACLGVGQCELLAPETFRLDDDDLLAEVIEPGTMPRSLAEQVVDRCPSAAISIVEQR